MKKLVVSIFLLLSFIGHAASVYELKEKRDKSFINDAVNEEIEVNELDGNGSTPLILAIYYGMLQEANTLLDMKADVNLCDRYNSSPLIYAADKGFVDLVNRLLDMGADPNIAEERDSRTALFYAAHHEHKEVVGALINKGADLSFTERDKTIFVSLARQNKLGMIEFLLENGANNRIKKDRYPDFSQEMQDLFNKY